LPLWSVWLISLVFIIGLGIAKVHFDKAINHFFIDFFALGWLAFVMYCMSLAPGEPLNFLQRFGVFLFFLPIILLLTRFWSEFKKLSPFHRGIGLILFLLSLLTCLAAGFFGPVDQENYVFGSYIQLGGWGEIALLLYFCLIFLGMSMLFEIFRSPTTSADQLRLKRYFFSLVLMAGASVDFLPAIGIAVYPLGGVLLIAGALLIEEENWQRIEKISEKLHTWKLFFLVIACLFLPWVAGASGLIRRLALLDSGSYWILFFCYNLFYPIFLAAGIYALKSFLHPLQSNYKNLTIAISKAICQNSNPSQLIGVLQQQFHDFLGTKNSVFVLHDFEKNSYRAYDVQGAFRAFPLPIADLYRMSHPGSKSWLDLQTSGLAEEQQQVARSISEDLNCRWLFRMINEENTLGFIAIQPENNKKQSAAWADILQEINPLLAVAIHHLYLHEHMRDLSRQIWEINNQLQAKVSKSTLELERALSQTMKIREEQENFFTMASHNLRTPLTSIKAASSLLFGEIPPSDKEKIAQILKSNIKRMEILISDIIDIVRMENPSGTLAFSRFEVKKIIDEVCEEVSWTYQDKSISWIIDLKQNIQTLYADGPRLKMVFWHLLSNAFKFNKNNGKVVVCGQRIHTGELISYNLAPSNLIGNYFEFSVADEGEGIQEEDIAYLFEVFHQNIKSNKRYQGNGLGLFMVKQIISKHGGAIKMAPGTNGGTVVSFILPEESENPGH
jgi:signal transduction histidine kinase